MTMHARVMRVALDDVERGVSFVRDQIVPSARQQPGIVAAYWLADRASGQGLAVTIWESEAAMLAADATAREAARSEQKDGAVESAALDLYEVIAHI
jgi:heme-degrading monooxygenase HmoA